MTRIANRDADHYTRRKEAFKGSNLFGVHHIARNQERLYVVYSYGEHFPIYVFHYDTEQWFANSETYSRTTSKHKGQAHPVWDGSSMHHVDTRALQSLIRGGITGVVKHAFDKAA